MAEHTKLPWEAKRDVANRRHWIIWQSSKKTGAAVARTANWLDTDDPEEEEANGAFIVQACNTHAAREKLIKDLVTALEAAKLPYAVAIFATPLSLKRDELTRRNLLRLKALEAAKKEMP